MTDCPHATVLHSMRPDRDGVPKHHWACDACDLEFWPLREHMAVAAPFRNPAHRGAHSAIHLWSTRCARYAKLYPDVTPESPEGRDAGVEILADAITDIFAPIIADEVAAGLGLKRNEMTPLEPRPEDPTKRPPNPWGDVLYSRTWIDDDEVAT